MWILFEVGVFFSRMLVRQKEQRESEFSPMSDDEMEAELDRMDQEDDNESR
jgi:Sec-independent protein secretion pathway component TatC